MLHGRSDKATHPSSQKDQDCFRPYLNVNFATYIFGSYASQLAPLPEPILVAVIQYYGKLDAARQLAQSIDLKSFADISFAGRLKLLKLITQNLSEAHAHGVTVLTHIELLPKVPKPI